MIPVAALSRFALYGIARLVLLAAGVVGLSVAEALRRRRRRRPRSAVPRPEPEATVGDALDGLEAHLRRRPPDDVG